RKQGQKDSTQKADKQQKKGQSPEDHYLYLDPEATKLAANPFLRLFERSTQMKDWKQKKKYHSHADCVDSKQEHPALLHLILIHIVQYPASLYRSLSIRFHIKLRLLRRCKK